MAEKSLSDTRRRRMTGRSPGSRVRSASDRSAIHEINNAIQGMVLHVDLLRSKISDNAAALKNLAFIEEGLNQIRNIVTRS